MELTVKMKMEMRVKMKMKKQTKEKKRKRKIPTRKSMKKTNLLQNKKELTVRRKL